MSPSDAPADPASTRAEKAKSARLAALLLPAATRARRLNASRRHDDKRGDGDPRIWTHARSMESAWTLSDARASNGAGRVFWVSRESGCGGVSAIGGVVTTPLVY